MLLYRKRKTFMIFTMHTHSRAKRLLRKMISKTHANELIKQIKIEKRTRWKASSISIYDEKQKCNKDVLNAMKCFKRPKAFPSLFEMCSNYATVAIDNVLILYAHCLT